MAVEAEHEGSTYRTRVITRLAVDLTIGHTIPRGAGVASVELDGQDVPYEVRTTHRGTEVLVDATDADDQELVVEIR